MVTPISTLLLRLVRVVIDGKKVSREVFFETLNAWGKDTDKKFVVLHRSILSEGINVRQLECVIFMRNMDIIEMTQTIGRVFCVKVENLRLMGSVLSLFILRLVSLPPKDCRRLLILCLKKVRCLILLFVVNVYATNQFLHS